MNDEMDEMGSADNSEDEPDGKSHSTSPKAPNDKADEKCKVTKKNKVLRWTWKKPPGKPCRPLSGYNLYFADVRKQVLEEKKTSGGFGNLARMVSDRWKAISPEVKAIYQKKAEEEKAKYRVALAQWEKEQEEKKKEEEERLLHVHDKYQSQPDEYERSQSENVEVPTSKLQTIMPRRNVSPPVVVSNTNLSMNYYENLGDTYPMVQVEDMENDVIAEPELHRAVTEPELQRAIAVVTEGKSGIGKALASKIARFPFIDCVLSVSRSISYGDIVESSKIHAIAADIGTEEGRQTIIEEVRVLCNGDDQAEERPRPRQLRFLIHCASCADPIKSAFDVRPDEMRRAMAIHCEAPLFLTTALYPFMESDWDGGLPGRVLHVSSGHCNNSGGTSVSDIAKTAFFYSYRALEREVQEIRGGKVVLGAFKTGVADGNIAGKSSMEDALLMVETLNSMNEKEKTDNDAKNAFSRSNRPTLEGVFDTPDNAANFVEYLLLGTTDDEFANRGIPHEYGIQKKNVNRNHMRVYGSTTTTSLPRPPVHRNFVGRQSMPPAASYTAPPFREFGTAASQGMPPVRVAYYWPPGTVPTARAKFAAAPARKKV